jgi:hypothetical protein
MLAVLDEIDPGAAASLLPRATGLRRRGCTPPGGTPPRPVP